MWAQSWSNIYDILVPYPNATQVDATPAMVAQVSETYYWLIKTNKLNSSKNCSRFLDPCFVKVMKSNMLENLMWKTDTISQCL